MACARNLGIIDMPIVCVNVNGFYNDFQSMLQRAQQDDLLYHTPQHILHFEDTVLGALQWMERQLGPEPEIKKLSNSDEEDRKRLGWVSCWNPCRRVGTSVMPSHEDCEEKMMED